MANEQGLLLPITELLPADRWPADFTFADGKIEEIRAKIFFDHYEFLGFEEGLGFEVTVVITEEIGLEIPGLRGPTLVIGGSLGEGTSSFRVAVVVREGGFALRMDDAEIALRFPPSMLKPVAETEGGIARPYAEIALRGGISLDQNLDFRFDGFDRLSLRPAMVGDSGVVIAADDLRLDLSRTETIPEVIAAGFDESFLGVFIGEAKVELPDGLPRLAPEDLILRNAAIGSGGVSGRLEAHYSPSFDSGSKTFIGQGAGELFGIPFGINDVVLVLKQNAFLESQFRGQMLLPFFARRVRIEIGLDLGGTLTVNLGGSVEDGDSFDPETGLLSVEESGIFKLKLEAMSFDIADGALTAKLSGEIMPLIGKDQGLDWPSFQVKELAIDSEGNVHLDGGWLDLREQHSLDFHGFQLEITKLGFGKTEDGGKYIGFSGNVKLVDGLSAGASVEGLRVIWYDDGRDTRITFNGVGVEFEVPDVLRFKGAVSYNEEIERFDGAIKLDLIALDLRVDGALVVGSDNGHNFMAIFLAAELPAGIPLWSTGLALYGMAGLFALNFEPNKRPDEEWYGIGPSEGWYKRSPIGVADFSKWASREGSVALGAGVTIGTVADNGYAFSGRMLLAINLPGPVLLIEGKANLLQKRAQLAEAADPTFRALAVLDNRAGTFLFGLDARYEFDESGRLLDIRGGAEAFFDFDDHSLWHLYLGEREPREKRIRAELFKLFEADAYFMLDAHQLALGAWIGYDEDWKFGPLRVEVEAWIEGNAVLSLKPRHFHGDLWLHGKAELAVWRFGVGLTVDANIEADVLDPFHLLGEFTVGIRTPWPLPNFEETIPLEWGPEIRLPPLPLPLADIAIEHFLVTTSWPLPRGQLLQPNFDRGDGFLVEAAPDFDEHAAPPDDLPVVPIDGRPHVTFGRPVNDDANIGVNPQPADPERERIGDPTKNEGPMLVRYGLKGVALHKWEPQAEEWALVARKGSTGSLDDALDVAKLYGSWAPIPAMTQSSSESVGQVKLWLWSKTPFDYTRHGGGVWDDWFTAHYPEYPCISPPPDREICCNLEEVEPGEKLQTWQCHEDPSVVVSWKSPEVQTVTALDEPVEGLAHALCFSPLHGELGGPVVIQLQQPVNEVRITLIDKEGAQAVGFDAGGNAHGPFDGGEPDNPHIVVFGQNLTLIELRGNSELCILQICLVLGPDPAEVARREDMIQHLQSEMERWSQTADVLEPDTIYRLKVVTTVDAIGEQALSGTPPKSLEQVEFAFFRTQGPPGLAKLSVPIDHPNPEEFASGLDDLTGFVCQTVPATVPKPGEKQPLPTYYRAYDVSVQFNQNYVFPMYALGRRDLGLYLYDSNDRPVRDARGRIVVITNRWGKAAELTLEQGEIRWSHEVNTSDCASLDTDTIPRDDLLTWEGPALEPDTVYEGRLVPLLLHENFEAYSLGASASGPIGVLDSWEVLDEGTNDGPSHWEIRQHGDPPSRYIVQTANIWGGTLDRSDPVKPGTLLLRGSAGWTDYRMSVFVNSGDDDSIGVVFRYKDPNNFYQFSMDREGKYRRVTRVVHGFYTVLAGDDFVYRRGQDYLITVEAIGVSLRIYQDGESVFKITDEAIDRGRIGLYCWGNREARFTDIRVDDFRSDAPTVYRFKFTTSEFANFFHHLHSFQDESWRADLKTEDLSDGDLATLVGESVTLDLSPSEDEARAFEALAQHVLGQAALQIPSEVQVTRVERTGEALAFLVQSPEPVDWKRTELELLRAEPGTLRPKQPGAVKLTDVTFGITRPNEESVTVLVREPTSLTAYRIEHNQLPGPMQQPTGDPILFADHFDGPESGLLFNEDFGPSALDRYTIVDEGTELGPSAWAVSGGHIVQTSDIFGGSVSADALEKPGTLALTGSPQWANVRIRCTLRPKGDSDGIGIVFHHRGADTYYRFSMDREREFRRLVKMQGGEVSLLWEDSVGYNLDQSYELTVEAFGDRLIGYLDHALLFSVRDPEPIGSGQVGFYCWANAGAHFEHLSVETLESPPLLWQPTFADLNQIEVVDEPESIEGPSQWVAEGGVLSQFSNIHVEDGTPHRPGTYALGGSAEWRDITLSVQLRSDSDGAIGVMLRVRPEVGPNGEEEGHTYYRFSMEREGSYRRLVKKIGDVVTVLWEDSIQYAVGRTYNLTVCATDSELSGYLDGMLLFVTADDDLKYGQIGFYCAANASAHFQRVLVSDSTRRMGSWTTHDDGTVDAPSVWRRSGDALLQTSNIHGGNLSGEDPVKPGTYAVAGDPAWNDYRMTTRMRSDDDDAIGVIFRYIDGDDYYMLSLDAQRSYRRLTKKESGVVTTLWESAGAYMVGEAFELVVDAIGARLVGYLDGARLFDLTDDTHPEGRVGLYCWGNPGARFERVEVRRPPLEAYALLRDHFAKGETSDWIFIDEGAMDGPSTWNTVENTLRQSSNIHSPPLGPASLEKKGTQAIAGDPAWSDIVVSVRVQSFDDHAVGLLFRYSDEGNYYRFSMDRERRYRRLVKNVGGVFSLLWEDDFSYDLGRNYNLAIVAIGGTLRGYMDGVPVFAVEDGDLTAGRIGLYCWGNEDSRFSEVRVYTKDFAFDDWLLNEPFEILVPGHWSFVDHGDQLGPSGWEVVDGELRQTTEIFGGSADADVPDKPGTVALGGDTAWADYRLIVRLTSDDEDGGVGAVFRYLDGENYYRFSMDRFRSYRRLVKVVGGKATILWEDDVPFLLGREYTLTLDCVGQRLTGFLDGTRLYSVGDEELRNGQIGLYCWGNSGARFAEVQVGAAVWATFHVFGPEDRMPAGTRIRVFAGNEAEPAALEPLVLPCFAASMEEQGHLRLPTKGATIRLIDPGETVVHSRRFLPSSDYALIDDVRVLRRGDGTGFFLFVPAETTIGSTLSPGDYRMKMTYHRKPIEPESQAYSQAGATTPEDVIIDVPWEAH